MVIVEEVLAECLEKRTLSQACIFTRLETLLMEGCLVRVVSAIF